MLSMAYIYDLLYLGSEVAREVSAVIPSFLFFSSLSTLKCKAWWAFLDPNHLYASGDHNLTVAHPQITVHVHGPLNQARRMIAHAQALCMPRTTRRRGSIVPVDSLLFALGALHRPNRSASCQGKFLKGHQLPDRLRKWGDSFGPLRIVWLPGSGRNSRPLEEQTSLPTISFMWISSLVLRCTR